ncbi:MAG: Phosphomannomutase/phosphoglucomutase [bacterium ADurb.Bin212]|nr:MAG: Phosphomannomutase/phosphoglucomutase [bacterium ADurb.Bin212]
MKKIEINPHLFRSLDIRGAEAEFVKAQNIEPGSAKEKSAHGSILSPEIAKVIGRAIAVSQKPKRVVVGHDARRTSPALSKALIDGLLEQGVDVDFIGLVTTDKLYFAIGHYKYDIGVMNTGSHTIKELNGFKISKYKEGKVMPVAKGSGMEQLKEVALEQNFPEVEDKGKLKKIDISEDFEQYILSHFDYQSFNEQRVICDGGNGSAGSAFEGIIDKLPIKATKLYFEPNGEFPNHEPDPMVPENLEELVDRLKNGEGDFGVAWDGDADRISFITPDGEILTGGFITAMLLPWVFKKHPHSTVICTPPMSWACREIALEHNAKVELAEVGNSFVKNAMEKFQAPFAGEEADHFMFNESFNAESGILPLMIILERLTKSGQSFVELLEEAKRGYFVTGDVNIEVQDYEKLLKALNTYYQSNGFSSKLSLGDLQVVLPDYHYNIHPSHNDPVVRLNLEAKSKELLEKGVEDVKKLIKELS